MLCIDVAAQTAYVIGDDLAVAGLGRGANKWSSATLASDGCLYCVPYAASRVLKIEVVAAAERVQALLSEVPRCARSSSSAPSEWRRVASPTPPRVRHPRVASRHPRAVSPTPPLGLTLLALRRNGARCGLAQRPAALRAALIGDAAAADDAAPATRALVARAWARMLEVGLR